MHCISKVKLMKFRKSCVGEFLFIAFLWETLLVARGNSWGKACSYRSSTSCHDNQPQSTRVPCKKSQGLVKNLGREIDISRENKNLKVLSFKIFLVKLSCE